MVDIVKIALHQKVTLFIFAHLKTSSIPNRTNNRPHMPSIALVNTAACPCPWTHGAACREFLAGWRAHGFSVGEATTLEECKGHTWLLLSNHKVDWTFLDALAAQNPTTIFLLWFYHSHVHRIPFKRWILTGEHYVDPPTLPMHAGLHRTALAIPNYHPLWLRANEDPALVGTLVRSDPPKYLGYFAGSGYKRDWVQDIPGAFYHDVSTSGLLTMEQRRTVALQSMFAFGFHSPENVANHHVTQRVFEGMAWGCIVLSDNPAATKLTGGIVVHVGSRGELLERIAYFLDNPEAALETRRRGYAWIQESGTNRATAAAFLAKAEELGI